jgi:hypothetical protein
MCRVDNKILFIGDDAGRHGQNGITPFTNPFFAEIPSCGDGNLPVPFGR